MNLRTTLFPLLGACILALGNAIPGRAAMPPPRATTVPTRPHTADGSFIPPQPPPHLVYGLNVRDVAHLSLVPPTGFTWIKLWEEYGVSPQTSLPYHVLYAIDCPDYVEAPDAWGEHVSTIARAGLGHIAAYEICNEPNLWGTWGDRAPDPARFTQMLCEAYTRIKAVDPGALVISGGLAPVGRVEGEANGWPGHNGTVMDERTYLRAMLTLGAGRCMDGFGYHPYGFAYEPERDADTVSNGFAFRGAEAMRAILVEEGWGHIPIWATEFNWLRDPLEDGYDCSDDAHFRQYFAWMIVSAEEQADYLVRAYAYADRYWPWMQGMFVWNLDWHTYQPALPCLAARYFALRRDDGSDLGAETPAYQSLSTMPKRPAHILPPVMEVTPTTHTFETFVGDTRLITADFAIRNAASGTFTWTAWVDGGSHFTPTLPLTLGQPGESLLAVVDPAHLPTEAYPGTLTLIWPGTFTATLTISATTTSPFGVVHAPRRVTLTLRVRPERHLYLPIIHRER